VPIRVHHPDRAQAYPLGALIDSGADATSFPEEWAEVLGIDPEDSTHCQWVKVKTGNGITYHAESKRALSVEVEDQVILVRPRFAPVDVAILGRRDLFMCFRVEFDERERVTRLTPYDDDPGPA